MTKFDIFPQSSKIKENLYMNKDLENKKLQIEVNNVLEEDLYNLPEEQEKQFNAT